MTSSDGQTVVAGPSARIALQPLAPELFAAMERLAPPGEDEELLAESILAAGSVDSLARWYYHVDQFRRRGLIRRVLYADGLPLATFSPLGRALPSSLRPVSDPNRRAVEEQKETGDGRSDSRKVETRSYVLSRFAYVRREGEELVLESPLSHARVVLHDPRAMSLLGCLATPGTLSEVANRTTDLAPADTGALLALLCEADMVDEVGADVGPGLPLSGSADVGPLDAWEFHDLLFHSRSRNGRSAGRFGGTYHLAAHRPPPPALKPTTGREWHELYRPDLALLERDDPPLARVQARRRSIREYAAQPISARQLGEFLYRVARVTKHWQADAHAPLGPVAMNFTARPYPAGGGLYELEFYAAVRACEDLEPGLYHYDPEQHRLLNVSGRTNDCNALLDDAATSAGLGPHTLQVLIILAARFERIAWKYESIAYSLILKDVGVVYQTMYLAATAMNLAPCALGCGDSDLFARAADTNYYVETSVGEFLLGSIK